MTRSHLVGVLAAVGTVGALVHPWTVSIVGALVVLGTAWRLFRRRPGPRSRWRRGWWAVALAVVPTTVAALPGIASGRLHAPLGVTAATAVILGIGAALPTRDPDHARSVLPEVGLAGVLVAYLTGAVLLVGTEVVTGVEAIALVAELTALWALVLLLRRERDLATTADRRLALAVGALVLARICHLAAALGGPEWLHGAATAAVAAGLVVWGAALSVPALYEEAPVFAPPEELLHLGHVLLVVAGVIAGPMIVVTNLGADGGDRLAFLAVAGGLVALVAVLHLLRVVRDHGEQAWRARHDPLTDLPTEPLFQDRVEQAIARARRAGSGLAVAFVDLDGFKRVNDRDGHEAGDEVLRAVALRLRGALREQDTVARKSGDEFLVLLPGVDAPADAERVVVKLLDTLRDPIVIGDQRYRIGASIGLALWPRDGNTVEDLVRHADAAMYEVKGTQGGAVRWYTTATTARTRLRLTLAQQLEVALDSSDHLELAYQPRVDLRDGRIVALVALVRWRHPELGLLTPRSFLPIAAEAGLTGQVDSHVLRRACGEAARLRTDGLLDVPITVHLSDIHLAHPRLDGEVDELLRDTGLPADRLVLAVTEGGLERDAEPTLHRVQALADDGVGLLVSRFGTGAVSLATLAGLPEAGVELASSHVAGSDGITRVIEGALAVADQYGFEVTANGVSSGSQAAALREAKCVTGRGPHLAPPLFGSTLTARLTTLAGHGEHDPASVPVAGLLSPADAASPERPELAAALAAAVRVDSEVEERELTDVLTMLGQSTTDLPVRAPAPARAAVRPFSPRR